MEGSYGLGEVFDDYMLDWKSSRRDYRYQRQTLFWMALGLVVTGLVVLSFGFTVLAVTFMAIGMFFG